MTATLDQTGRPAGHPGHCQCDACADWLANAGPGPAAIPPRVAAAKPPVTPEERTADYTRRIHWWVRLFGVAWIASLVVTIIAVAFWIGVASKAAGNGQADYDACIARGVSPSTCYELHSD